MHAPLPHWKVALPALGLLMLTSAVPAAAQDETVTAPTEAAPTVTESETAADEAAQVAGEEIDRRFEVLASEIEQLRLGEVAPSAETSFYGMGPAASKVYQQEKGVAIGGYGEMLYQNFQTADKDDKIDFYRAILYAGYKFNDKWVLNTEFEFEHIDEVVLEFAYIDYLQNPAFNVRAGLVLIPMGLINELHEPTTYLGALRPEVERRILPTTWRENGVGIFGDVGPFTYKLYGVNGLVAGTDSEKFSSSGLRSGRQKGKEALAEDFAGIARLDFTGVPGLLVGGSAYFGESDQNQFYFNMPTFIWEAHLDWKWKGLEVRGLYSQAKVKNAALFNQEFDLTGNSQLADTLNGWYAQAGYDVLNLVESDMSLVPYVRYEQINTQAHVPVGEGNPANDKQILTVGAQFYPIDQIVIKADYQDWMNENDTATDQWNVLLGYIF